MTGPVDAEIPTLLRLCATLLREYASREQPSQLGLDASAGPAAWHRAYEAQIPKVRLRNLADDADAAADRIERDAA